MSTALKFIDPAELSRITDLQLIARTVVNGVMSGMHRSARTGASIEFKQYRPYVQGDDPRHIDWPLYGRTDRLHIRQFQEETNLNCTLLLDCSASMDYGSHGVTKFRYAQMLVASLAMMLGQQRDTLGLIGYHEQIKVNIPPRAHSNQLNRVLVELANLECAGMTDSEVALRYLGDVLMPRGMVILVSDLLHPLEGMIEHLRSLRAQRHDVLVLQITDPAERDFPFEENMTLVDVENGLEQFTTPTEIRDAYLENRNAHFERIRRECLAFEIDIAEFSTDEPLDTALQYFLRRRHNRLTTTSGRRRSPGGPR